MRMILVAGLLLASCHSNSSSGRNPRSSEIERRDADKVRTVPSGNGPFGIEMGSKLSNLGKSEPLPKAGMFEIKEVGRPDPEMESVLVEAYPTSGVCQIRGIGRDLQNDGAGSSGRAAVEQLAEALRTKYGAGKKLDSCSGGDVACESEFFMMTLRQGERYYGYSWENLKGRSDHIGSIYLALSASDSSTTYPVVEYHSDKTTECKAAAAKLKASSL